MAWFHQRLGGDQAPAGDSLMPWGANYLFKVLYRSIVTHDPELEHHMAMAAAAEGDWYAVWMFWAYCKAKRLTPHFSLVIALCHWPPTLRGFVACVWHPRNISYMLSENLYTGSTISGVTWERMDDIERAKLLQCWLLAFLDSSNVTASDGTYRLGVGLQQLANGLRLFPGAWMPEHKTPNQLLAHIAAGTAFAGITSSSIVGLDELLL